MRPSHLVLALLVPTLAACPGDDTPTSQNPARLYLALDGGETAVRLVPMEPQVPF